MGFVGKLIAAAQQKTPSCTAVIAAGGSSQRMGGQDKLFAELDGCPVLLHTLRAFAKAPCIGEIVVVARKETMERVGSMCAEPGLEKVSAVVSGGASRLHSVYAGVLAADRQARLIAVHDGARPLVSQVLIEKMVDAAEKYQAAIPLLQIRETVKTVKNGRVDKTLDRSGLYTAQTPQVFDADLLKAALQSALEQGRNVTDDAQAAEQIGLNPAYVEGERHNIKITGPEDLLIAAALLGGVRDANRTGL